MFNKALTGRMTAGKRLISVILAVFCIFSLCACSSGPSVETSVLSGEQRRHMAKIHDSIKNILGFDIDDAFIEEAEIMSDSVTSDTFGKIRIRVKSGKEKEIFDYLLGKFGNYQTVQPGMVTDYQGHEYVTELKRMSNIRNFVSFRSGSTVKSSPVDVYLADQGGDTYLFIFG